MRKDTKWITEYVKTSKAKLLKVKIVVIYTGWLWTTKQKLGLLLKDQSIKINAILVW